MDADIKEKKDRDKEFAVDSDDSYETVKRKAYENQKLPVYPVDPKEDDDRHPAPHINAEDTTAQKELNKKNRALLRKKMDDADYVRPQVTWMQHLCDNDEEFLPEDYEKRYGKDLN